MTLADKIRKCNDEQLSQLLTEMREALIAVEVETNHDLTPEDLLKLLKKPLVPDTFKTWLEELDEEP